jgi:hypothetical protein
MDGHLVCMWRQIFKIQRQTGSERTIFRERREVEWLFDFNPVNFRDFRVFSGKIFSLIDYSDSKGKVVSINETNDPAIFSVFRVLSG